ncbi:MAG: T9SS type A sorting domain-containing protein [Crocinitomicaceae bacterium]|jgi:hypothetical protein
MNKKLLLSFAVFAAGFAVNAQKSLYKGIARKAINTEFVINSDFDSKTEVNPTVVGQVNTKKRLVTKTIKDTLSIAGNKKTYGHPHHAYSTNRTMKLKMYKSGNDTEFLSANQRYDNSQPLKLSSFAISLTAYHDNTPVVALVTLRSKKTNQLDSIVPVELNINRVNSGSGNPTSSARWFTPISPINISDTFMIEVLPAVETDSVGVTATGAYYGSTRAVASISGTTLTVNKAIQNDSTFAGWALDVYGYFKGGFVSWNAPFNDFFISGENVLPGTYITGQTGQYTYTVNQSQTVAETNITQDLKTYNSYAGLLGVASNKGGTASFNYYPAFDDGVVGLESDWLMYPVVEYTVDSDPKANDVCKGDDGSVSVTFDSKNRNVIENPTLNKLAFFQEYLGYGDNYFFYSTVQNGIGSTKFVKFIDYKAASLTVDTKLDSLTKSDSLFMVDYILPYGYFKNAAQVTFGHLFPISSSLASTTATLVDPILCNGGDAKVNVAGTVGGFAPYTGEGEQTGVKAGERTFVVTDANGCSTEAKLTVNEPAVLSATASSVDASNDKTNDGKASVVATGGTAPYTYEWSASAGATAEVTVGKGDYTVVVKDANSCSADAAVTVKAGTASIAALAISNLSVYPNPVKESLTVKFDSKSAATVELVNVAGQVIDSKVSSDVTFNTSSLVSGVYFVNIKVAEGVFTQKVIKD